MDLQPDDVIVAEHPDHGTYRADAGAFLKLHEAQLEAVHEMWERARNGGLKASQANLEAIRTRCVNVMRSRTPELAPFMRVTLGFDEATGNIDLSTVPEEKTLFRIYRDGEMIFGPADEFED